MDSILQWLRAVCDATARLLLLHGQAPRYLADHLITSGGLADPGFAKGGMAKPKRGPGAEPPEAESILSIFIQKVAKVKDLNENFPRV